MSDGDELTRNLGPLDDDSDNDGLSDGVEIGRTVLLDCATARLDADATTTSNPVLSDTDNDGMPDGLEDRDHNGALAVGSGAPRETAANNADTDADGLCDGPLLVAGICKHGLHKL